MTFDEVVDHLAASHTHAERDNDAPVVDRTQALVDGELVSWCWQVAQPANRILDELGYTSRLVALLALEPYADGTYEGHQLIEAWHPDLNRWVVIDIDYGIMLDQRADELTEHRTILRPLETDWREPGNAYAMAAGVVGIRHGEGPAIFDPTDYTTAERKHITSIGGWESSNDFGSEFYGN